jgi:hypothetical protein
MKKNIYFLGKIHYDVIAVLLFWIIIHLICWYVQGFTGLYTSQLLFSSLGVSILLFLLLSNSGKGKKDSYFSLPLINSYYKKGNELKITPGGLNMAIRVFYFLLAIASVSISSFKEETSSLNVFDIFFSLFLLFGILFFVIKYLKNRNDFILINTERISWFDDSDKKQMNIDLKSISSYEIESIKDKRLEYPKKIILHINDIKYCIDLEKMSMMQFSDEIIEVLKKNWDSSKQK